MGGAALALAAQGCAAPVGEPLGPSPDSPVILTRASLDWADATITLPLDRYGMSPAEFQLTLAAQSVVFARCATQTHEVSEAVLAEARRALSQEPAIARWLYGRWNQQYVAQHSDETFREPPAPMLVTTDTNTELRCLQAPEYRALEPISSSFLSTGEEGDILLNGVVEASDRTLADPRFTELISQLNECVLRAGYRIETDSPIGGVHLEATWDAEQRARADVAEAVCNDDINLTQKAADINAEYQADYITAHEAEVVETKRMADARLAEAREILIEVGVL